MKNRLFVILAITMLFFTSVAVSAVPAKADTGSKDQMQVNMSKLEPDLLTQLQNSPSGDFRIFLVLNNGFSKEAARNLILSLGGQINGEYNLINAISASISGDKLASLTSLASVNRILIDGKKSLIPVPESDGGAGEISFPDGGGVWYSQFPFWLGADKAWNMGIDGSGVTVAVLDTGIFYEHIDLEGVVTAYRVFTSEVDVFPHDGYGHGTSCSGCIASQGIVDWDLGVPGWIFKVKGVAPGAKIIGAKVLTDEGWGWDSWIVQGMEWAVESGANVISCSFGGLEIPNDGNDPSSLALDAAAREGVVSFVAASNDQGAGTVSSPACASDVITVGASTENSFIYWWLGYWPTWYANDYENDQVIFWSSGGPTADGRVDPNVCAVGAWGLTLDTYPYYLYFQFGGTSMATPVAAGVGALAIQAYRQAHGESPTPREVKNILMNTAQDMGYGANRQGSGRVDAYQAVLAAMSERCYSNKGEIDTGIIEPGHSYTTKVTFSEAISSAYATHLVPVGSESFTGLTAESPDTFVEFTIPDGVEYAEISLKFAPEYAYGVPIRDYDGSQWTDVHLNTALYRVEDGSWTLLGYAYAHTNIQWFDARVTPGDYVLWIWNAYDPVENVDIKISYYRFDAWGWVSTYSFGNCLYTQVKVPRNAAPGTYSGFVNVACGEELIKIPVVVTVPAEVGKTFTVETDITNEPRAFASGDWLYIPVEVNRFGFITLTVSWTTPDADFDVYLITPRGNVEALSQAPSVPFTRPGGGGKYWYTVTGTTMEVLSALCRRPGMWYVLVHSIYLGNTFSQKLTVELRYGSPISAPNLLALKGGSQRTFSVDNKISGSLLVFAMALSFKTESFSKQYLGTVHSVDFEQGYVGYDAVPILVTPDMLYLTASIDWTGSAEVQFSLTDPAGANRGLVTERGQSITICDPTVGYWYAIVTIQEVGSADYTLSTGGLRYQQLSGVTLFPSIFMLAPHGKQFLTLSANLGSSGTGFIVYYDLITGSIYAETLLFVTSGWHHCR